MAGSVAVCLYAPAPRKHAYDSMPPHRSYLGVTARLYTGILPESESAGMPLHCEFSDLGDESPYRRLLVNSLSARGRPPSYRRSSNLGPFTSLLRGQFAVNRVLFGECHENIRLAIHYVVD